MRQSRTVLRVVWVIFSTKREPIRRFSGVLFGSRDLFLFDVAFFSVEIWVERSKERVLLIGGCLAVGESSFEPVFLLLDAFLILKQRLFHRHLYIILACSLFAKLIFERSLPLVEEIHLRRTSKSRPSAMVPRRQIIEWSSLTWFLGEEIRNQDWWRKFGYVIIHKTFLVL